MTLKPAPQAVGEGVRSFYKGAVKESDKIIWTCEHNHYKEAINARYQRDTSKIWEISALNCARAAIAQMEAKTSKVVGGHGLVSDDSLPQNERDNMLFVDVSHGGDVTRFAGAIQLLDNGERSMTVVGPNGIAGTVDLSRGKTGISLGTQLQQSKDGVQSPLPLKLWCTAVVALRERSWGIVFRKGRDGRIETVYVDHHEGNVAAVLGSRQGKALASATHSAPRIRVVSEGTKRLYEVVNGNGEVVSTEKLRGKAMEALQKLKKKG